ncbi:MAG: septum formation initiator family protein [Candidatus Kerfeldbacteria bacterium]|nr:septum formation initiator family protein [Candidatus Kerfeldbacteria bacterium]
MENNFNFWSLVTSRLFMMAAVVALLLVGFGVVKGIIRYNELHSEINKIENDISTLESQNQELNRLLAYLATPEFKERVARLQFNMQKPGEHVIVVPGIDDVGTSAAATTKTSNLTTAQPTNWKKWLKYFFP